MVKNLSVFFPCFNEEENLPNTVGKAIEVLEKLKIDWELLIINDGSSDNTKEVAEGLAKKNPKIKIINHTKNLGYGKALRSGFENAKYETIVYNDGDGQFDFSEITKFLEKIEDNDLIIGYRIKRKDNFLRILFKEGWRFALLTFFGLTLRDVDCGFKMIKKSVLEKIPKLESTRGGMINAELAIKAKKFGFKVTQVGVHHYPRKFGKPTGANLNVIITSFTDLFKLWWNLLDKKTLGVLFFILAIAFFLRIYKIDQYMSFLGDEGRDALVIKRILIEHHPPLLGPGTSIGNMYLGPLYYYMMAIPMAIFWLNPVAAAGMVAIITTAAVGLIYYLGKSWFGFWAGVLSSFLYAISPVNINYGRSSWNPNPAPFFTLLAITGLYKLHKTGDFRWFLLTGSALAFAAQMHYLALILIPITGMLWLYEVILHKRIKLLRKNIVKGTLGGIVLFLFLMSPLLIFDLRHNFMNFNAVSTFFLNRETTVNVNPLNSIGRMLPVYNQNLIGRYMVGENPFLSPPISILVVLPIFIALWKKFKGEALRWSILTLGVWLIFGLLGLSLYKQTIYDHYLGFLNPAPYLLLGYYIYLNKRFVNFGLIVLCLVLIFINISKSPLQYPPNNQLERTKVIAAYVVEKADEKPFNFALLSKNNYDSAYQYYLEVYNHKPKQIPFEVTEQLFVVCEDPVCEPIGHPKQEISHFGWAKIEEVNEFNGVKVFKLVSNPSGEPPK